MFFILFCLFFFSVFITVKITRFHFFSLDWVKINTDGIVRGSPDLVNYGGIFCGSIREFISGSYVFLDVKTVLVAEFYEVIHAIEQTQNMSLISS